MEKKERACLLTVKRLEEEKEKKMKRERINERAVRRLKFMQEIEQTNTVWR